MTATATIAGPDPPVLISYEETDREEQVLCRIDVPDASLHGSKARLRIERKVVVRDSRGIDRSETIHKAAIASLQRQNELLLPRSAFQCFSYRGEKISVELHSVLEVRGNRVVDLRMPADEELALHLKPEITDDAKEIIDPADAFCFVTNLKAIPPQNQLLTLLLLAFGMIVILINTAVGIHDQFVPEELTWVYSHTDSDGDANLPLLNSLVGSGLLGTAVWLAMRRQLRKYMSFHLGDLPPLIRRDDAIDIAALLRGRSRVPLEDFVVRVVACNMEKGQYLRGSGTKERTVSFSNPVRSLILFEQRLDHVPAGAPIEDYLRGSVEFEVMFRALYPPQPVGKDHGLTLHWEAQLLHDKFVDQELICPDDRFRWEEFLRA
jgi:hypothetical protein